MIVHGEFISGGGEVGSVSGGDCFLMIWIDVGDCDVS